MAIFVLRSGYAQPLLVIAIKIKSLCLALRYENSSESYDKRSAKVIFRDRRDYELFLLTYFQIHSNPFLFLRV